MGASVPFDTLKFVERLEAGGFTHVQAKAAAEAFAEATGQELATKADISAVRADLRSEAAALRTEISAVRTDLRSEAAALRTEIAAVRTDLRSEVASVRSEIRELELRMTIKLGGLMVVATGVILAAIRYLPPGHP